LVEACVTTWDGPRGTIALYNAHDRFESSVETIASLAHLGKSVTVLPLRLSAQEDMMNREDSFVFVCELAGSAHARR
jgi:hypothetical protein